MRDVMRYSGIVTKAAAMRAKLLKQADYKRLAGMSTVTDIIEYLKETRSYGSLIEQMDESLYHRGSIEKILVLSLYDDYSRLYRFADMAQKEFLRIFMKRYEVELLEYCFRIVFNHYNPPFDINYKRPFFDRFSDLRIEYLMTAQNIEQLVENLKDTEYYAPLKRVQEMGSSSLLDYDLALDLYYFSAMWKVGKGLGGSNDRKFIKKELGTKIDLLNLQWIYRSKKYYHMLAPDIYNLLIPIQYRIRNEELKELVEAPSAEEFGRRFEDTFYGRKYQLNGDTSIESIANQCLEKILRAAYRNHPYSLASIYYYLFQKEEEIYKITTALECVRYGLSERETLQYFIQEFRQKGGNAG